MYYQRYSQFQLNNDNTISLLHSISFLHSYFGLARTVVFLNSRPEKDRFNSIQAACVR